MTNVICIIDGAERYRRMKEIAERNRRNYNRWRIRWLEYHQMLEYEPDFNPYHLMTGRTSND